MRWRVGDILAFEIVARIVGHDPVGRPDVFHAVRQRCLDGFRAAIHVVAFPLRGAESDVAVGVVL